MSECNSVECTFPVSLLNAIPLKKLIIKDTEM